MKLTKLAACIAAASLLAACGSDSKSSSTPAPTTTPKGPQFVTVAKDSIAIDVANVTKVLENNADIALAAYSDSVATATALKTALATFKATPNEANLAAAKKAWLIAREPYGQTEVYRFRNSPIDDNHTTDEADDGPEGSLNAWPLGEALIDYVVLGTASNYGDFNSSQIGVEGNSAGVNSANKVTLEFDDKSTKEFDGKVDVANASTKANANNNNNIIQSTITINSALLDNSASTPDEHDVISGYHAIEFMLWGQDLNAAGGITTGTDRDSAVKTYGASDIATGGQRPLTDFTSDANATRRHQFMEVAVDKLIAELTAVRDQWKDEAGTYRKTFTTIADATAAKQKLTEILTGMGTLSEGELGGERMQIAYSGNSQEDEHSCFSDNTHRDVWLNAEGVSNSFYGTYAGYDHDLDPATPNQTSTGVTAVNGYGLDDYLRATNATAIADAAKAFLSATEAGYKQIDSEARAGKPFDVLIMPANRNSANPISVTIKALNAQSVQLQNVATGLGLGIVVKPDASACDTQDPSKEC